MDTTLALFRGDCLAHLASWPDGTFDAVVTDPPYSSGGAFRGDRMGRPSVKYQRSDSAKHADFHGDNRDQRSWGYWCTLWLSACRRVSTPGAPLVVFVDWRQLPTLTDAIQAAGWVWRGVLAWDKGPSVRPQKGRFRQQAEFVAWGTNGPAPTAGDCLPGAFRIPAPRRRVHASEKPVELLRQLVHIVRPGGVVLDPFAGSCTTGEACALEGRGFVGVESSEHYYRIGLERLGQAARAAADVA